MASASRQKLVDDLQSAGLENYPKDASTDQLRQLYVAYSQAKSKGCYSLSDDQLFQLLKAFGSKPGPVLPSTRSIYQDRLQKMLNNRPVARGNVSQDMVVLEQRSTQVGGSLLSSFAKSVSQASTPSPIRINEGESKVNAKSPQTSTPKKESSAALGLFTGISPGVDSAEKRTPPRQSRLLGDYSLSDIPSKAPASTVLRRSVWPTQRPFVAEIPQEVKRAENFRQPLRIQKPVQVYEQGGLSSSTRTFIQIGVVVAIGIIVLFAYIMLEENPRKPVRV